MKKGEPIPKSAAIIISAYKAKKWIAPCINSLIKTLDNSHAIFVLDNAFNENSIPLPFEVNFPNYYVLKSEKPLGFSEANNYVLKSISQPFPYVCFLNQDTISEENWLDDCIVVLSNSSKIGAISPSIKQYVGENLDPAFIECQKNAFEEIVIENKSVQIVPEITAAALVVKSNVLFSAGPFDTVFESYCEDFDLCDRIKQSGYSLGILKGSWVRHYSGSASTDKKSLIKKGSLSISNRALLKARRNPNSRVWISFYTISIDFIRRVLRAILNRKGAHPLGAVWKSFKRSIAFFPRMVSKSYDQKKQIETRKELNWDSAEIFRNEKP